MQTWTKRWFLGLGAAHLLLSLLHIHGFSFSAWHSFLDGSAPTEVWMGKPRDIRSDDWMVLLPMAFAQVRHDPPFPIINRNIGFGHNMLVIPNAPVIHPVTLFRPHSWGYFLGEDFGLAWNWNVYVFGFLACFSWLFLLLSRGHLILSVGTSVALLLSPFFQFWALNSAFLASTGALGVCLLRQLALIDPRRKSWAQTTTLGLALGWTMTAFVLTLYPPFQVAVAWSCLAIAATLMLRDQMNGLRWHFGRATLLGLAIAGLVVCAGGLSFWLSAKEAILAMMHTSYPGQRFETGGDAPIWKVFSNLLMPMRFARDLSSFRGNICESSSFLLLFPWLALGVGSIWIQQRWIWPILGCLGLFFGYCVFGFSDGLAAATGFSRMPTYRTPIAFGILDASLIVATLSSDALKRSASLYWKRIAFIGLWILWAGYASQNVEWRSNRGPEWLGLGVMAALLVPIFWNMLSRPGWAIAFFVLANAFLTFGFNPVTRGGSEFFRNNPLSAKMLEIHQQDRAASWLVYSDHPAKILPQALGLHHWGGVHFHPQAELWAVLDPESKFRDGYNRYAHLFWGPPLSLGEDSFRVFAVQSDVAKIEAPLDHPRLLSLPFTYVLTSKTQRVPKGFSRIFDYADFAILKRSLGAAKF